LGIAKTKKHLPKGPSAKRASECGLFLVFRGNRDLGIAGISIKNNRRPTGLTSPTFGPRRAKGNDPS